MQDLKKTSQRTCWKESKKKTSKTIHSLVNKLQVGISPNKQRLMTHKESFLERCAQYILSPVESIDRLPSFNINSTIGKVIILVSISIGSLSLISKLYIPIMSYFMNRKTKRKEVQPESSSSMNSPFKNKPSECLSQLNMREFWYPVCFSEQVSLKDPKPYSFKLLGEPLILFRVEDGSVECCLDLCPHRSAKLSTGVVNEFEGKRSVECAYHGWRFGKNGECHRISSVESSRMQGVCSTVKAQTRSTYEFAGMIWVWPSTVSKANPDLIPRELFREEFLEGSEKPYVMLQRNRDIPCHYSLVIDNLLDMCHLDFTHDGSLGNRTKATQIKAELVVSHQVPMQDAKRGNLPSEMNWDRTIHEGSFMYRVTKPEFQQVGLKKDFANLTSFIPPCFVRLDNTDYVGSINSSNHTGEKSREGPKLTQVFCMIPTEENKHRVLIRFYSTIPVLNYLNKIPFVYNRLVKKADQILDEDLELLFGIQENITKHGAKIYNRIMNADSCIKSYRDWEKKMLHHNENMWFQGFDQIDMEDLA
ncbi:hypothetical protein C9374_001577 [Naegleria lovaniensis]|uniref:Rieske domain-containing protein n=1 Tax=Naegleria lovaniensis TaxID=51637 RepID=A0AA88GQX6_NAELO|nr:uncharacterized protein C9374_001577 [Naegleria lovaniensis]KAG2387245.1 hypothetical protein C9374_001577 [Naegleria lovaniensis]